MVKVIHILANGTVKNDITGTEVPKEQCNQLYRIITRSDNIPVPLGKEEVHAS